MSIPEIFLLPRVIHVSLQRMREEIARLLLKAGAVALRPSRPFVWASGIHSPIYCDNRLLLSNPKGRNLAMREFERIIRKGRIRYDAIAGIATAGIPWASMLADRLKKPLLYVRSKAKSHGRGNKIEGRLEKGSRVLVIEDLVSTGQSSLEAVKTLRRAGRNVRYCLTIFSYGLAASRMAFEKSHCRLYTLTHLETLLAVALKDGRISGEEKHLIEKFSQDPQGWLKESSDEHAGPKRARPPRRRKSSRRSRS